MEWGFLAADRKAVTYKLQQALAAWSGPAVLVDGIVHGLPVQQGLFLWKRRRKGVKSYFGTICSCMPCLGALQVARFANGGNGDLNKERCLRCPRCSSVIRTLDGTACFGAKGR